MKKLIILFLLLPSLLFSQVSPSKIERIADANTVFGSALSYGTYLEMQSNNKTYKIINVNGVAGTAKFTDLVLNTDYIETGTVTSVSTAAANNGVTATWSMATPTPALTIGLGAITPTSVNGLTLTALATGFTVAGGTTSKTLTVPLDASVSGTNTGDQTNITGNAATVTTNANLTGPVTSTGNATAIANGAISNAMLANGAVANLSGTNTGDQTTITGNAGTVTTNANLTGPVTSTGNATAIANGAISNAMLANGAVANLSGTNTGDQTTITGNAGTVTTNANLTGPITSTGNATSIASQTGTGTMFVMNTSPTLVTPIIGAATGTSLSVSGQLTSTVATGTAPLVVSSTTVVPNLNIGGNAATATTAGTVTTNANLTGMVTSSGNATTVVTNANLTGDVTSSGSNATTVVKINGTSLAGLATGILKNTTGTGVPSVATAGTDFVAPNGAIVAATNTKITYDAKGLVTSGSAATLASADFANQGTTTTVLHGNAAGNPSFGQIVNADITNTTIDLTAKVTGVLPSANGGTANGFTKFTGPTTAEKTFTLPDASATILTDNALVTVAQGGTGVGTFTSNGVLYGNTTTSVLVTPASTEAGQVLQTTTLGGAPTFSSSLTGVNVNTPTLAGIAAAGTTQGAATALTNDYNEVTTVTAASATGVILPTPVVGRSVYVVNKGSTNIVTLNVFPASGHSIDGQAANIAYTLPPSASMEFKAISTTKWYTVNSLSGPTSVQVLAIATGGTYTPTPGTKSIVVELVGGGASGGGVPTNNNATRGSAGGGGGAGGYTRKLYINITSPSAAILYTIGAVVTGTAGAAGTAGVTTTFDNNAVLGTMVTALGGSAGPVGPAVATGTAVLGGSGGAAGAAGDFMASGGDGGAGFCSGALFAVGGQGGNSFLGGGGLSAIIVLATNTTIAGGAATNYGGGGSGAVGINSGAAGTKAGGSGSAGTIIVTEYK